MPATCRPTPRFSPPIRSRRAFAALMPKGFARPTAVELNNYWGNFGNALVAVIDKGTDPTTARRRRVHRDGQGQQEVAGSESSDSATL